MDPSWLVILAFYAAWRWRPFSHYAALSAVADPDAEQVAMLAAPAEVAVVELEVVESRRVVISSGDLDSWVEFRNRLAHEFLQALVPAKGGQPDLAQSESVAAGGAVKSTAIELDSRPADITVSPATQHMVVDNLPAPAEDRGAGEESTGGAFGLLAELYEKSRLESASFRDEISTLHESIEKLRAEVEAWRKEAEQRRAGTMGNRPSRLPPATDDVPHDFPQLGDDAKSRELNDHEIGEQSLMQLTRFAALKKKRTSRLARLLGY